MGVSFYQRVFRVLKMQHYAVEGARGKTFNQMPKNRGGTFKYFKIFSSDDLLIMRLPVH